MNLPNLLTVSRFFLSFVVVYLVLVDNGRLAPWALATFLLASMTDYWDGALARRRGQTSVFGALLDPIADKALTLCAFLSFWKLNLVPGLWVAVVASRDVLVTAFRLFSLGQNFDLAARPSGKGKTLFQMVYICAVLGYLACRGQSFWDTAWNAPAERFVRGGMLVAVLLALWSGTSVLLKRKRKNAVA